jgi:hypothetical protein
MHEVHQIASAPPPAAAMAAVNGVHRLSRQCPSVGAAQTRSCAAGGTAHLFATSSTTKTHLLMFGSVQE